MTCIISGCEDIGVFEITDAKAYPEKYNGKKLCRLHFEERQYMKENDIVAEL